MLWARLEGPGQLAVANLHGSVDSVHGASEQVLAAADRAVEWAGAMPLVFGGDLNLRVTRQPEVFGELSTASASPRRPHVTRSITCSCGEPTC